MVAQIVMWVLHMICEVCIMLMLAALVGGGKK